MTELQGCRGRTPPMGGHIMTHAVPQIIGSLDPEIWVDQPRSLPRSFGCDRLG